MQGLLDVYTAFFHRWRFQLLRLEPVKEWKVSLKDLTRLDCNVLSKRGLINRFTYTCTHQIQKSLQTGGHCKQHYLHCRRELKLLHNVRLTCILGSCTLKIETESRHMQTHSSDSRQNCILLCMLSLFFVCMYGCFNFFF